MLSDPTGQGRRQSSLQGVPLAVGQIHVHNVPHRGTWPNRTPRRIASCRCPPCNCKLPSVGPSFPRSFRRASSSSRGQILSLPHLTTHTSFILPKSENWTEGNSATPSTMEEDLGRTLGRVGTRPRSAAVRAHETIIIPQSVCPSVRGLAAPAAVSAEEREGRRRTARHLLLFGYCPGPVRSSSNRNNDEKENTLPFPPLLSSQISLHSIKTTQNSINSTLVLRWRYLWVRKSVKPCQTERGNARGVATKKNARFHALPYPKIRRP